MLRSRLKETESTKQITYQSTGKSESRLALTYWTNSIVQTLQWEVHIVWFWQGMQ